MCEVPEIAGGQSITLIATYDETPYKACHPKRSEGAQACPARDSSPSAWNDKHICVGVLSFRV